MQPVAFERLVLAVKTENEKDVGSRPRRLPRAEEKKTVMLLLRVLTRQREMEPGLKKTGRGTGGCSERSLKLQG
jgi:hypothetical protein